MSLSYEKKIEAAKAEFKKKLSPDDASKFDACADPRKPRFYWSTAILRSPK